MAASLGPAADAANGSGSRISSVPLLGEGFEHSPKYDLAENSTSAKTYSTSYDDEEQETAESPEADSKSGRRRFWGLGRKKEDEKAKKKQAVMATTSSGPAPPTSAAQFASPLHSPGMGYGPSGSHPSSHPYASPSSPGRNMHSSPRMSSPASSQIFERNVQEDGLYASASPAIPAHITTENHIPPVLDSASAAITDDHLDPDSVEIVMHSAHQPAALAVTGTGTSEATGAPWQDDLVAHPDNDDAASNYGALDSNDVRRLSFISFADVVHAEHVHAEHADHSCGRDSIHLSSAAAPPSMTAFYRSPSPIRSPAASHGLDGSSPTSGSVSFKGHDTSFGHGFRGPGSPHTGHSPPTGGELTIETMRQALRKTGSGDLSGARSQPMSAVGGDDGTVEHPFR
jgi:hypothetical protein